MLQNEARDVREMDVETPNAWACLLNGEMFFSFSENLKWPLSIKSIAGRNIATDPLFRNFPAKGKSTQRPFFIWLAIILHIDSHTFLLSCILMIFKCWFSFIDFSWIEVVSSASIKGFYLTPFEILVCVSTIDANISFWLSLICFRWISSML